MILRFTYDIVCPYAFLASTLVEEVARAFGATVDWDPVRGARNDRGPRQH